MLGKCGRGSDKLFINRSKFPSGERLALLCGKLIERSVLKSPVVLLGTFSPVQTDVTGSQT